MKSFYLTGRFFSLFGGLAVLFVSSFWMGGLYPLIQALFVLALALTLLDTLLLFGRPVALD
ncbi:hypothetical protein RZS08_32485, partial [Arthrospira platensis SPKY1]|nr:hypothetical protein [Arthrospira platensis SPKY1]